MSELVKKIAKTVILRTSLFIGSFPFSRHCVENTLKFLHVAIGQGAGSGWDIESEVAAALRFVPLKGAFVIDAGANTGVWSEMFLQCHSDAQILAVEPLPAAVEQIKSRNLKKLKILQAALSSKNDRATLFLEHPLDVAASLTQRMDSPFVHRNYSQIEVQTLTLDSVIPPGQVVHFLKMDLEGHELDALQGARHCLDTQRIQTLQFEFGSANINTRSCFLDFWNLLTPHGYSFFRIIPGGGLWPVSTYTEELEYYRGASNYIASICPLP